MKAAIHSVRSVRFAAAFLALTSPVSCFFSPLLVKSASFGSIKTLRGGSVSSTFRTSPLNNRLYSSSTSASETATLVTMTSLEKVQALRKLMEQFKLDVYLVPSDDPHLSGKQHHDLYVLTRETRVISHGMSLILL